MIRSARAGDADAVRQLVHDAYRHYVARIGKPPGPMLDDYALLIAAGQVWVMDDAVALAGVLVLKDAGVASCCWTTSPSLRPRKAKATDGRL